MHPSLQQPMFFILGVPFCCTNLPLELILHIVGFLDYKSELSAISRCSREFYEVLNSLSYTTSARNHDDYPLRWAAAHGVLPTAQKALVAGIEPSTQILALACLYGHEEIVQLLCKCGVNPNLFVSQKYTKFSTYEFSDGEMVFGTPLAIASKQGHESIVQLCWIMVRTLNLRGKENRLPLLLLRIQDISL
ncbi:hypothetical protein BJY04DRAFT_191308 [Aspergillus karnatakaensis]|uniref:uncharacterized protein n=1 Tax=Aspergillus karnatakaensis TaxID=1810916 RepID=UPI003CCDBEB0